MSEIELIRWWVHVHKMNISRLLRPVQRVHTATPILCSYHQLQTSCFRCPLRRRSPYPLLFFLASLIRRKRSLYFESRFSSSLGNVILPEG